MPAEDTRVRPSPVVAPPPPAAPASHEHRPRAGAQGTTLRLPAAAWSALLSALALDPRTASLPGTATVLDRAPGGITRIEYAGRTASFTAQQPLAAGTTLHLVRATLPAGSAAASSLPSMPPMESALIGETLPALARLLESALRDPPAPLQLRLETLPPAATAQLASALAEAVSASALAPASDGAAAFRHQMAALASGELTFQIPAWPGQSATLAVREEQGQATQGARAERVFLARLETQLPGLGLVRATLTLNAGDVDIDLRAAVPETAIALAQAREALARALDAADLRAARIEVSHEHSR